MKNEKEEDLFVHATSERGDALQVTFVDDCLAAVTVVEARLPPELQWELLKRDSRQMNMKPTQEMTFLIGRTNILRLLQFQDLGV